MTTILVLVLEQRVCRKSYSILTSCFGESDKYRHLRPSPGQEYELSFILTSLGQHIGDEYSYERWGVLVRESTGLIVYGIAQRELEE